MTPHRPNPITIRSRNDLEIATDLYSFRLGHSPLWTSWEDGLMPYSPGEVAEKTGFSIDTLRYYERIGLLAHIDRTAGGRRAFTDADVEWLGTLRCLRDTGMPIARMRRYAELTRSDGTEPERLSILEEHDEEVGRRIAELRAQRTYIQNKIAWYREMAAMHV
jgi:DNA-binding transcriptional MerR regulator